MKHRAVSLRQLSFLLLLSCNVNPVEGVNVHDKRIFRFISMSLGVLTKKLRSVEIGELKKLPLNLSVALWFLITHTRRTKLDPYNYAVSVNEEECMNAELMHSSNRSTCRINGSYTAALHRLCAYTCNAARPESTCIYGTLLQR